LAVGSLRTLLTSTDRDPLPLLIGLTLAVNGLVLLFPTVYSDAVVYGLLSKNIATSGDWVNLTLLGQDWLDKPHLPFWLTALSFKMFGINSVAYLIPGLIFHLIGAVFTYRLAKHFYGIETARLSALMYLTAAGLLWSTVDLRAEAYLVGEIVPACYFWVKYDEQPRGKYLLGGAVFTAMAVMTKGLFVIAAIGGGLAIDWLRRKEWRNFIRPKWLLALGASLVCILPEVLSLYAQFDRHPEKVIFGRTGVSGVRFFFWDSQFGRFFNFGPIQNTNGDPFFFLHTFLWAFLPWTVLFIAAIIVGLRSRKQQSEPERRALVILSMSFLVPFVLFSLTTFQFDHYIDIVLPFAAILSANFLARFFPARPSTWVCRFQVWLSVLVCILALGLSVYAFRGTGYLWSAAVPGAVLALFVLRRHDTPASKVLVFPVLAVQSIFVFLVLANWMYFLRYDAAHKLASDLARRPDLALYDYRVRSIALAFHARQPYEYLERFGSPANDDAGCFIVSNDADVEDVLHAFPNSRVVARVSGVPTNRLAARMFNRTRWFGDQETTHLSLVQTGLTIADP
jgi:4-amino-4-deoxy-L-arabinose transferase-like glycosyltransferase